MRFILDKAIAVYRLTKDPLENIEEYRQADAIRGIIMPVKAEDIILSEGNPADMFKLYTDFDTDIRESDKVECEGVEYIVKYVLKRELRALSRVEAIIYRMSN